MWIGQRRRDFGGQIVGRLLSARYRGEKIVLLGMVLLVGAACSGGQEPAPAPSNPTARFEVVVFETAAPTDTPLPVIDNSAATPSEAIVGVGANAANEPEKKDSAVSSTSDVLTRSNLNFNRPPDVNPLTGLKVDDPAVLKRRPLMVRVGNDPGARPQVGLNKADLVYEEIVEWWVTRFTAIYLSQDPNMIAPIRSARLINLQLVPQYQGALANSGGSDGVRWELSQISIVNLDEFFVPQPYFYRENEGWQTRLAFDAVGARDYLKDEGLESDVKLRGFLFDESPDLTKVPEKAVGLANEVVIPYPQVTSEAKWIYDPASGKYLRFTASQPMNDFDGSQIAASNVIIYFADHQATDIVEDSNGATSIRININGKGAAWLLRDGTILKGNWETDGTTTPDYIFDDGTLMPLKPGNIWVEVVPLDYEINIDGVEQDSLGIAAEETGSPGGTSSDGLTPTLTPIGARPNTSTPVPTGTETAN